MTGHLRLVAELAVTGIACCAVSVWAGYALSRAAARAAATERATARAAFDEIDIDAAWSELDLNWPEPDPDWSDKDGLR